MTDDTLDFGLGGIASPPDENDWSIESLYAMAGAELAASPPPSYLVPAPFPPILNQHATPMCVAYSSAMLKGYEDLRDTGPATFDEPTFFSEIGGTANGAIIRNALAQPALGGLPRRLRRPAGAPQDRRLLRGAAHKALDPVGDRDVRPAPHRHPLVQLVVPPGRRASCRRPTPSSAATRSPRSAGTAAASGSGTAGARCGA
jgi:hypothetical protein